MKKISKKTIINKNLKVNSVQLNEVIRILRNLRNSGVHRSNYNIAPPFSHKPTVSCK